MKRLFLLVAFVSLFLIAATNKTEHQHIWKPTRLAVLVVTTNYAGEIGAADLPVIGQNDFARTLGISPVECCTECGVLRVKP